MVTQWEDEESFAAWRDGPAIEAHSGERAKPVSSGADLLEFEVVMDVRPTSLVDPLQPTRSGMAGFTAISHRNPSGSAK